MKPTAHQPLLDDSSVFGWDVESADSVVDRVTTLAMRNADLEGKCALLAVGMKRAHERCQRAGDNARGARRRERLMLIAAGLSVLLSAALVLLTGGH